MFPRDQSPTGTILESPINFSGRSLGVQVQAFNLNTLEGWVIRKRKILCTPDKMMGEIKSQTTVDRCYRNGRALNWEMSGVYKLMSKNKCPFYYNCEDSGKQHKL